MMLVRPGAIQPPLAKENGMSRFIQVDLMGADDVVYDHNDFILITINRGYGYALFFVR